MATSVTRSSFSGCSITNVKTPRNTEISHIAHSFLDQARKDVETHLTKIDDLLRTDEQYLKDLAVPINDIHRAATCAVVMGSQASIISGALAGVLADSPIAGFTVALFGTTAAFITGSIIKCCGRPSVQYYYTKKNITEMKNVSTELRSYLENPLFLEKAYRCFRTLLKSNPGSFGDCFAQFLCNKENKDIIEGYVEPPTEEITNSFTQRF